MLIKPAMQPRFGVETPALKATPIPATPAQAEPVVSVAAPGTPSPTLFQKLKGKAKAVLGKLQAYNPIKIYIDWHKGVKKFDKATQELEKATQDAKKQ